ncbi:baseplate assembly protein [Acinetobacter sp. ANC 4558]|uniref:phage baseplate assembly protein domain-containing protein n=1 Tax=Acinetobacter sp. ANC 4558 TaxID=1977876 RepID=UPI000A32CAA8|nr:phage baseplate assembly protein [Acinetobacter sp. ANC 4558]OTG87706.1 baseplate assembly protein [Acinetobacter sp. ANC 4558]
MVGAIRSQVAKGLGQVRQAFFGIVARGSSKALQLTGFADETLQEVEIIQQVGFSSFIPKNAKVVVIPLNGKTAKSVVVATSNGAISIEVGEGETCIYDQHGHSVWLKADGTHVSSDLFVDGKIIATQDIQSTSGDISDQTGSIEKMRQTYNVHTGHGSGGTPSQQM